MKYLLCLFVIVALVCAHEIEDERIDAIIHRHWVKHLDTLPSSVKKIVESNPNTIHKKFDFHCDHDDIMNNMMSELKSNLKKRVLRDAPSAPMNRQGGTYDTERFYVNNTLIDGTSSDPRACYTVGQQVQFGTSGSSTCNTDGQSNCLYTCTSADIASVGLQNVIRTAVLPAVLDIFENILTIQRVTGNLLLNAAVYDAFGGICYPGVPIPSNIVSGSGTGLPNADMLVIGAARPSPSTGTVAYALSCNFDWDQSSENGIFGRPLAGHVNFSPRYFQQFATSGYSEFDFKAAVKVGVHEFTHALGFSSTFYQSYLNTTSGKPYAQPTKTITRAGTSAAGQAFSVSISLLTTPKMTSIAQKHYGCDTMEGVELENYGGSGTAGSHWELREVQNEYMAGYINSLMPVSYLTMGLLEDMGWYKLDYTKAEYWTWGKGQGCSWVQEKCETSWTGAGYFCSATSTLGCTADRNAKGNCNVGIYQSSLPAYYQHFSDPKKGGGNPAADCCPYIDYVSYCGNATETANGGVFEFFGTDSLCWEIGQNSQQTTAQACYQHRCNSGNLEVNVNNVWLTCPSNGGTVSSTALNGVVNCPSYDLVCGDIFNPTPSDSSFADSHRAFLSFIVFVVMFCLFFQELVLGCVV